jgi:hypothetical protein
MGAEVYGVESFTHASFGASVWQLKFSLLNTLAKASQHSFAYRAEQLLLEGRRLDEA